MKAIILAACLKTDFYSFHRNIPQALLKLGNKTLLDHLVRKLERLPAINEIIVVSDQKFFSKFREWQKYSAYKKPLRLIHTGCDEPGNRPGGLGDLELALRPSSGTPESFLVFCPESYFDFRVGHFLLPCLGHPDYTFIGLSETGEKANPSQCAVAEMDANGKIVRFEEKHADPVSTHVSVGVYYLPAKARLLLLEYLIEARRPRPEQIVDFMTWLAGRESVYGVVLEGEWFDVGFRTAHEDVTRQVSHAD
jgi:glucose-1-phosphate thymidylyltransferase